LITAIRTGGIYGSRDQGQGGHRHRRQPRPIVDQLNAEIRKAMQDPEVRQRWQEISSLIVAGTPEEFASLIRSEAARLGKVVRDSGAKVD
jgi:tripartite-type tricarboxylate transporter receptor subunit TctC